MGELSEWLQLMLAEITRKQEDLERSRAETARRVSEQSPHAPRDAGKEVHHCRNTFHSD
jgi:hypothetical protein